MQTFEVWAPRARTIEVKIGEKAFPLQRRARGWWSEQVEIAGPGTDYFFVVNGEEASRSGSAFTVAAEWRPWSFPRL